MDNIFEVELDIQYWDEDSNKWDTHKALNTISHGHFCVYDQEVDCDITTVQTLDGQWFIEDSWNDITINSLAFDVRDKNNNKIKLFQSEEAIRKEVYRILNEMTGLDYETLKFRWDDFPIS